MGSSLSIQENSNNLEGDLESGLPYDIHEAFPSIVKYLTISNTYFGPHYTIGSSRLLAAENNANNQEEQVPIEPPTAINDPLWIFHDLSYSDWYSYFSGRSNRQESISFQQQLFRRHLFNVFQNNPNNVRTATIRSDINISKPSIKLRDISSSNDDVKFGLEFLFDAISKGNIQVYSMVCEDLSATSPSFDLFGKDESTPKHYFNPGLCKKFELPKEELFIIQSKDILTLERNSVNITQTTVFPIVISIFVASNPTEGILEHKQLTYCSILKSKKEESKDPNLQIYEINVIQQKLFIDGNVIILEDIYGFEDQGTQSNVNSDGDVSVDGNISILECVICLESKRNTTILPCRHLCLCSSCAEELRYQTNKCPVCRGEISSLLQIKLSRQNKWNDKPRSSSNNSSKKGDRIELENINLLSSSPAIIEHTNED